MWLWIVGGVAAAAAVFAIVMVRRRRPPPPIDPLEWRRGGCGGGDSSLPDHLQPFD